MSLFKIISGKKNKEVVAVAVGSDEVIARDGYTIDDTATNVIDTALLKISSSITSGNIKLTLAGAEKTVITMNSQDVNESNVHVVKVWLTGTDAGITTSGFYLWQ